MMHHPHLLLTASPLLDKVADFFAPAAVATPAARPAAQRMPAAPKP